MTDGQRDAGPHTLEIEVDAGGWDRVDKPVVVPVSHPELTGIRGVVNGPGQGGVRVVEVDGEGDPLSSDLLSQLDLGGDHGDELVFTMAGTTPAGTTRRFRASFGSDVSPGPVAGGPRGVLLEDAGVYEGEDCLRISTGNATYYYHKRGSGFASMVDTDGNDWIGFHPTTRREDGPRGEYRGIPNIAPVDFHAGRGDGKRETRVLSCGPVRARLLSETEDGSWALTWDIYSAHATMTLLRKGPEPYWILYEGTPGGRFDLGDYWVHSSGERLSVAEYHRPENQWQGRLPSPKWVYFGDSAMDRVLFLALHEGHSVEDQFWHFGEGAMTVFGFGRGATKEDWQQLTRVPAHLTIGFLDSGEFRPAAHGINSAYRPLETRVRPL